MNMYTGAELIIAVCYISEPSASYLASLAIHALFICPTAHPERSEGSRGTIRLRPPSSVAGRSNPAGLLRFTRNDIP